MTYKRARLSRSLRVVASIVAVFMLVIGLGTLDAIASSPLFLPVVIYGSLGLGSGSVAVADLNGDGKPDLVVASLAGPLAVLLGNGDGTFEPAVSVDGGESSVVVADLNGDGKPDLVATNLGNLVGTVDVLLGNGDGSFQPAVTYASGGAYPASVAIADLNGDNKPDLVVTNEEGQFFGGLVDVLLGNGDGTFQPAVTYDSGGGDAWSVAVVDVNGDNKPDLVVANVCTSSCSPHGVVAVLLGNGDGTFQAAVPYNSGGSGAFSVAVGDVNGDGKPDIAVVNVQSDDVGVLLGNPNGSFQAAVTYATGGILGNGSQSVAVADVNGDGKLDLVVANCAITGSPGCSGLLSGVVGVLLGNGDGTFQPPMTYGSGGFSTWAVVAADVNGDGRSDLMVANYCGATGGVPNCGIGTVGVLLNNGQPPDTTPPAITLSATSKKLWPPNGRLVSVTLSGTITDIGSGVNANTAEYAVQDEYREVQPFGKITLNPAGNYSFTILLRAGRRGNDLNGRQYTIRVSAKDSAGNRGVQWARVTVPHNQ